MTKGFPLKILVIQEDTKIAFVCLLYGSKKQVCLHTTRELLKLAHMIAIVK